MIFSRGCLLNHNYLLLQVMDSYVAVKINEALYEMKERLQSVEEQFERVSEEKTKMEEIMKDKVHMIRVQHDYSACA